MNKRMLRILIVDEIQAVRDNEATEEDAVNSIMNHFDDYLRQLGDIAKILQ